ncbi:hypothetical protein D3C80_1602750 [compost metagenome]
MRTLASFSVRSYRLFGFLASRWDSMPAPAPVALMIKCISSSLHKRPPDGLLTSFNPLVQELSLPQTSASAL